MTNLFAYRATDPKVMKAHPEPVGEENDLWIQKAAQNAGVIVAAWGTHGSHLNRADDVKKLIPNLHCLSVTKDGFPGHPLYLKKDLTPVKF